MHGYWPVQATSLSGQCCSLGLLKRCQRRRSVTLIVEQHAAAAIITLKNGDDVLRLEDCSNIEGW
jgi:hypothetical protein